MSYNNNIPAGGNQIYPNDQSAIQANFAALGTSLGTNIGVDIFTPFAPAEIFAYRTGTMDIVATNQWHTLGFPTNGVVVNQITKGNLSGTFSGTFGEATNNKFTVSVAGTYWVKARVEYVRTGNTGNMCVLRSILNNTSEIPGSYAIASTGNTLPQAGFTIINISEFPVILSANDYLSMQVGSDSLDIDVGVYTAGAAPNPTTLITASIQIRKEL